MDVLITPAALAFINSRTDDPAAQRLIGQALRFEQCLAYRQHKALAQVHPDVRPVLYLRNGRLGLRHLVAEGKVLLFLPPAAPGEMHEAFFQRELAASTPLPVA